MEDKDALQELQAIRRFVRQTWMMAIRLVVLLPPRSPSIVRGQPHSSGDQRAHQHA